MRVLWFFLLSMLVAPTAFSQSVQTGPISTLGTLFSDLEKQIIRETLGTVLDSTSTTATETADEGDKAKARQKDKQKGRGNSRGKGKNKGLPPGLAKRDSLPPGLQKQLKRFGQLPPGLQKRDLPADLVAKLPPATQGTERIIVDQDVVLIEKATNTVLDVIKDVLAK